MIDLIGTIHILLEENPEVPVGEGEGEGVPEADEEEVAIAMTPVQAK